MDIKSTGNITPLHKASPHAKKNNIYENNNLQENKKNDEGVVVHLKTSHKVNHLAMQEDTTFTTPSPEETARQLVSQGTNLFQQFKEKHADMEPEAVLQSFVDTLGAGIEKGLDESLEALENTGQQDEHSVDNINKIKKLVQLNLQVFINNTHNNLID